MNNELICFTKNQEVSIQSLPGVFILDCQEPDVNTVENNVEMTGVDGELVFDKTYGAFEIAYKGYYDGRNDPRLVLMDLKNIIHQRGYYWIRDSFHPGFRYAVNKATLEHEFIHSTAFTFTLTFKIFRGYKESLGTTLSDFSISENIWQIGEGMVAEDHKYVHTTNHFEIYNAGEITVNPRVHDLIISIQTYSQGGFTIINKTTGEMFKFNDNERLYDTDNVVIDGTKIYKNGIRSGRLTNLGLISLVPGSNEIEIKNVSRVKTSWDFRFLYK